MRYFILFLFLIVIAVVINGCEEVKEPTVKNPGESRPMAPAREKVELETLQDLREKIKNRNLSENRFGRNDPFAPIGQAGKVKAKLPKTKPEPEFHLDGIIWDLKNPIAIIDGRTVKQGDVINGKTVEKINKNYVTLFDGKKRMKLRL